MSIGSVITLGLRYTPSLVVTLGYGLGAVVADDEHFSGGWPIPKRKTREDIRIERIQLGILEPDPEPEPAEAREGPPQPVRARRTIRIDDLTGKRAATAIAPDLIDIEFAVQREQRKRRRQQDDEFLLLMD